MPLLFRILIGLGLLGICGCNLNYYWHLARGQSRVVYKRISVQTLLARPDLAEQTRTQLELIQAIRRYAESVGLKTDDQYTTFYDTGGGPISWNVSACPPDRFSPYTWDFPFVGEVPYKGFFRRDLADEQRDALAAAGYDAIVRPVSAYSTLGFFSDPILSPMLGYAPDQLADLILHELTHALVYAPGQTDYNESLATFVGRQGSLLFLAQHFGPDTPLLQQAEARRADAALFRHFMVETVAALDSLYSLELPRSVVLRDRQVVFAERQRDFALIKTQFTHNYYNGFLQWELNNARLLSYRRYNANLTLFSAVYRARGEDLASALEIFAACAENDNPWQCLRVATEPEGEMDSDKTRGLRG